MTHVTVELTQNAIRDVNMFGPYLEKKLEIPDKKIRITNMLIVSKVKELAEQKSRRDRIVHV